MKSRTSQPRSMPINQAPQVTVKKLALKSKRLLRQHTRLHMQLREAVLLRMKPSRRPTAQYTEPDKETRKLMSTTVNARRARVRSMGLSTRLVIREFKPETSHPSSARRDRKLHKMTLTWSKLMTSFQRRWIRIFHHTKWSFRRRNRKRQQMSLNRNRFLIKLLARFQRARRRQASQLLKTSGRKTSKLLTCLQILRPSCS